jgi:hypothetical protein
MRVCCCSDLQVTPKSPMPRPRKVVISETHVTERDVSTYAIVTARPLSSVANVVRIWDDPQVRSADMGCDTPS